MQGRALDRALLSQRTQRPRTSHAPSTEQFDRAETRAKLARKYGLAPPTSQRSPITPNPSSLLTLTAGAPPVPPPHPPQPRRHRERAQKPPTRRPATTSTATTAS